MRIFDKLVVQDFPSIVDSVIAVSPAQSSLRCGDLAIFDRAFTPYGLELTPRVDLEPAIELSFIVKS